MITKSAAKEPERAPIGAEKLSGEEKYRQRLGDYRILYEIVDSGLIVTVVRIGNRREVYRR